MPRKLRAFIFLAAFASILGYAGASDSNSPIRFELKSLPFRIENSETHARNAPETMPGGLAVFDYNGDGRPDIFFTNGGDIATLEKDDPKDRNRTFRNDGNGVFTDVTEAAGLAGTGYDMGVAVADYDNDSHPDLFVAGLHHGTLYHNNGDGTFTDVTAKSGLDLHINHPDPEFGPWWEITAVWVDVNDDGWLDLFVVNYMQWRYSDIALCQFETFSDYCSPKYYKGQPDQLFLNNGDGTFRDASKEWGLRDQVGKGMGVGMADYDLDGPDLFVTNDASYNSSSTTPARNSRRSPLRPASRLRKTAVSSPAWDTFLSLPQCHCDCTMPVLEYFRCLLSEFRVKGGTSPAIGYSGGSRTRDLLA
jgi:hypothetical protein